MGNFKVEVIKQFWFDKHGVSIESSSITSSVFNLEEAPHIKLFGINFEKSISLDSDVLFCWIESTDSRVDVSSTLGRMALTGVAAGLFFKNKSNGFRGKATGAALGDYILRGSEVKDFNTYGIVLNDGAIIYITTSEVNSVKLKKIVGNQPFTDEACSEADNLLDLIERLQEDGSLVLPELSNELEILNDRLVKLKLLIESGKDFQERDMLRSKQKMLLSMRTTIENKMAAVYHKLGEHPLYRSSFSNDKVSTVEKKPKKTLILAGFAFISLIAVIILFYTSNNKVKNITENPNNEKIISGTAKMIVQESAEKMAHSDDCSAGDSSLAWEICKDPILKVNDKEIADLFDKVKKIAVDDEDFIEINSAFIKNLELCTNRVCILNAYAEHKNYLIKYQNTHLGQ